MAVSSDWIGWDFDQINLVKMHFDQKLPLLCALLELKAPKVTLALKGYKEVATVGQSALLDTFRM